AAAATGAARALMAASGAAVTPADGHDRAGTLDGRVERGGRETRALRTHLLPALHVLQERVGWISEGGLNHLCDRLGVPPAEAYGVATFYAMFRTRPSPPTIVHVCDDLACRINGAGALIEEVGSTMGPEGSAAGGATWMRSPCLGMCEQ